MQKLFFLGGGGGCFDFLYVDLVSNKDTSLKEIKTLEIIFFAINYFNYLALQTSEILRKGKEKATTKVQFLNLMMFILELMITQDNRLK